MDFKHSIFPFFWNDYWKFYGASSKAKRAKMFAPLLIVESLFYYMYGQGYKDTSSFPWYTNLMPLVNIKFSELQLWQMGFTCKCIEMQFNKVNNKEHLHSWYTCRSHVLLGWDTLAPFTVRTFTVSIVLYGSPSLIISPPFPPFFHC